MEREIPFLSKWTIEQWTEKIFATSLSSGGLEANSTKTLQARTLYSLSADTVKPDYTVPNSMRLLRLVVIATFF